RDVLRRARARAPRPALAAGRDHRERRHRPGRKPRGLRALPRHARGVRRSRALHPRQPRRPAADGGGPRPAAVPGRRTAPCGRLDDRAARHLPRGRGRGRLGSAAPPRARGLAREVRRPVRPPLHASSAPADGQRVARRRRPARRGGVPRDRRPPPAGPLRALGPRSPGLRSRAPRRALLEHAVDLRAVPAGERVLRARQPAARYALAHARARRRHRLRHRVARRGGPRGGCGMIRRLALWLAAALTAAGANADPAAWRATAPSGEELWLLGSMHYLRASDYPLPAPIESLIDGADTIVMELDLDDIDPIAQQRTLLGAAL